MNAKLIVYDWNGTLINDTWITAACFSNTIEAWGIPPLSEERFRHVYDVPWISMYKNLGITEEQIAHLGGHPIGENFLDDYESRIDQAELHVGTQSVLKNLAARGTDQIILSNHIGDKIEKQLNRLGVAPFFKTILAYETYSAEERKTTKLDKLRRYLTNNNLSPSDVAIVGDTPEEIRIAKELGLTSIAFSFGYSSAERLQKENPHHLVHSMNAFAALFAVEAPNAFISAGM